MLTATHRPALVRGGSELHRTRDAVEQGVALREVVDQALQLVLAQAGQVERVHRRAQLGQALLPHLGVEPRLTSLGDHLRLGVVVVERLGIVRVAAVRVREALDDVDVAEAGDGGEAARAGVAAEPDEAHGGVREQRRSGDRAEGRRVLGRVAGDREAGADVVAVGLVVDAVDDQHPLRVRLHEGLEHESLSLRRGVVREVRALRERGPAHTVRSDRDRRGEVAVHRVRRSVARRGFRAGRTLRVTDVGDVPTAHLSDVDEERPGILGRLCFTTRERRSGDHGEARHAAQLEKISAFHGWYLSLVQEGVVRHQVGEDRRPSATRVQPVVPEQHLLGDRLAGHVVARRDALTREPGVDRHHAELAFFPDVDEQLVGPFDLGVVQLEVLPRAAGGAGTGCRA
jgi:hypothetical protein